MGTRPGGGSLARGGAGGYHRQWWPVWWGRSESWLSQVERGKRHVDSHSVLTKLAVVLRVDIEELTGPPGDAEDGQRVYESAALIEQAMMRYDTVGVSIGGRRPGDAGRPGHLATAMARPIRAIRRRGAVTMWAA